MGKTTTEEKSGAATLKEFLSKYWSVDSVKKPFILAAPDVDYAKIDATRGDFIIIRLAPVGETEKPLGNYSYRNQTVPVVAEIRTKENNQRLHDLKYELRRVCYVQKHGVEGFQLVSYLGFTDESDRTQNFWRGTCRLELSRVGIYALE
jgi:hypothetical protein